MNHKTADMNIKQLNEAISEAEEKVASHVMWAKFRKRCLWSAITNRHPQLGEPPFAEFLMSLVKDVVAGLAPATALRRFDFVSKQEI